MAKTADITPKQRSAILTDKLWERLAEELVRNKLSSTSIAALAIEKYLVAGGDPIIPMVQADEFHRKRRTVYISDDHWATVRRESRRLRHKSSSALLEQIMRMYLEMDAGILRQS